MVVIVKLCVKQVPFYPSTDARRVETPDTVAAMVIMGEAPRLLTPSALLVVRVKPICKEADLSQCRDLSEENRHYRAQDNGCVCVLVLHSIAGVDP